MVIIQLDSEQLFDVIESAVRKALEGQGARPEAASTTRKILSLAEFCEYAGLTKQTAYKLTSAQKVPHSKRGKRLYFDRDKVDAWLLENQVATQAEIQEKANQYLFKKANRRRV